MGRLTPAERLARDAARALAVRMPALLDRCDAEIADCHAQGLPDAADAWLETRQSFTRLGQLAERVLR